jgi:MFS superfamily sulfate permease-like transporter
LAQPGLHHAGGQGVSVAFDVVFGVFVAMILALAVISVRWALRRDRLARARWSARTQPAETTDLGAPTRAADTVTGGSQGSHRRPPPA